jgi:hypothetical protein
MGKEGFLIGRHPIINLVGGFKLDQPGRTSFHLLRPREYPNSSPQTTITPIPGRFVRKNIKKT